MTQSISACEQLNLEGCFEPFNGIWLRLLSNNPSNDCMKVVISGNVAVLFANPKNVFWVGKGDNLWKNIEHVKQFQEYNMGVLSSDGLYYDAVLRLEGPNTIVVSITGLG